jgi:arylsulfatase A-like enzyme
VQAFEKGFFLRSRHFVWMVPVSDVAIFGSWGLLLAMVSRRARRLSPRPVIGSFLFLACMSLLLLVRGLQALTCVLLSAGIAYRAALWIATDGRFPGFCRLIRLTAPVLMGMLAVLVGVPIARDSLAGRRPPSPSPSGPNSAPNVLLIVLDTVRADHLSLYGYGRDTTPNLTRLANQGARFQRARAAAPWTLPSHASLFTGRWPHELGVERLGWLDGTYTTLAEFLRMRGYSTGGFVANHFFCGHESGLSRGFDTYRDYPVTPGDVLRASSLGWFLARNLERAREDILWAMTAEGPARMSLDFPRKTAAAVNREFLDWLDHRDDRPFFAFLNYFDAHDPYLPPDRPDRPFGAAPRSRRQFRMLRDWQTIRKEALDPASLSLARDAYDDCLASLDRDLGRLFEELRRRDLLEPTLLILTADHGEQFGEHGSFGHGLSLYEPEVHVPLVIVSPGRVPGGMVVDEAVSLRDVPATVVDLIGGEGPSPFLGRSLARTWSGSPALDAPSVDAPLSELESPIEGPPESSAAPSRRGPSRAILAGQTVYLRRGDGTEEMYDLDLDPTESRNLSGSERAAPILARCRRMLRRLVDGAETPGPRFTGLHPPDDAPDRGDPGLDSWR